MTLNFDGKFYDPEYGVSDSPYDGTIKAFWEICRDAHTAGTPETLPRACLLRN